MQKKNLIFFFILVPVGFFGFFFPFFFPPISNILMILDTNVGQKIQMLQIYKMHSVLQVPREAITLFSFITLYVDTRSLLPPLGPNYLQTV